MPVPLGNSSPLVWGGLPRLHRVGRGQLPPRLVRSMFVVVLCVLAQQDQGVGLVVDQDVIEQFSAEGTDEALADCIRAWRPWRGLEGTEELSPGGT